MADDQTDLTRELFDALLNSALVEFRTEIEAQKKALALAEQFPTAIDKAIHELRELHGLRIAALEKLFDERFKWMEKLFDERCAAMKALLKEQHGSDKEARDKAEKTLVHQLKQIEETYASRHENTRTLIEALKERMTLLTGGLSGAAAVWGYVVGILGLIIAALAVGTRISW